MVALGSNATASALAEEPIVTMIAPTMALVVALNDSSTPKKTQMPKPEYDMQPLDGGLKLDGIVMVVFKPVLFATAGSEVKAPTPAKKDTVGMDASGPGNLTASLECPRLTCPGSTTLVPVPFDETMVEGAGSTIRRATTVTAAIILAA
jgi:hypothetical protein